MDAPMTLLASLQSNPLIARSIRQRSRLSVRRTLLLSVCIALLVSAFCLAQALFIRNISLTIVALMLVVTLMIAGPPLVAYLSASFTLQELHSEQYELVHVTALSDARLVQGYVYNALHRSRFIPLLIAGFSPFFVLGGVFFQGYINCYVIRYSYAGSTQCQSMLPLPSDAALWLVMWVILFVCLGGLMLLAANFGVLLAVLFQNPFIANFMALLGALIGTLLVAGWGLRGPLPGVLAKGTVLAVAIYAASRMCLLVAQPFARRRA
jgi:hypothetical protein